MINIAETKGSLFRIQEKGNTVIASFQTGKKFNDKWDNMYWNVKFVGKDKNKLHGLPDKTRIKIIKGVVELNKYLEKYYTNVIVFEFEILEDKKTEENKDIDDIELPF